MQAQLVERFRRPAVGEATTGRPQPEWNYDPRRLVTLIRMPQSDVVWAALKLYQDGLRRPSLIAYCLDFSGSMQGEGESALKDAMSFVLTPREAASVCWSSTAPTTGSSSCPSTRESAPSTRDPASRAIRPPARGGGARAVQGRH